MHVSPQQDGQLRRLHFFQQVGATLSEQMCEQKQRLRSVDRRGDVREPADQVLPARLVCSEDARPH